MPVRRAHLTPSQEESVAAICNIGPSSLERVVVRLRNSVLIISSAKIRELIANELGADSAEQLSTFLFSIAVVHRRDEESSDDILRNISTWLSEREGSGDRLKTWEECYPLLAELLKSPSIRTATKALEVSYDFERIYVDGRFITSIRPIFDPSRKEIWGATVVQTLRLEFMSAEGDRSSISIALDKADIKKLVKACEQALDKGEAALKTASETWDLPTIMPGEAEQ